MADKKLQVFVSSTYEDLKEERQAAVMAILKAGHIPAGMELFAAGDKSQMEVIKRWIDESDVYMLLLGGRYGSIDGETGKSYTHLEFEYAVQKEMPLFSLVIKDDALEAKVKVNGSSMRELENPKEFKAFKQLAQSKMVEFWEDYKDIRNGVLSALTEITYNRELVGWVRGDRVSNSALLADETARLSKENGELREKILFQSISQEKLLYNGLAFEDLKRLLTWQACDFENTKNSYDYLVEFGHKFAGRIFSAPLSDNELEAIKTLRTLKVIKSESNGSGLYFSFTPDGHNFYLKQLLHTN